MQSPFVKYVRHGWRLIPLEVGEKLPRQRGWNRKELSLSEPGDVEGVKSAGLAHAYSGTCAIDIDDIRSSIPYMQQFDIDLKEMYLARDAVRILSGRKNRAKLIYALPEPLPSIKIIDMVNGLKSNIIDFRCGTADGQTVQDALPPSIHPKTNEPYYWSYGDDLIGDWENLPSLPEDVLAFWLSQIHERDREKEKTNVVYTAEELADLLKGLDPDVDFDQWVKFGMAVHDGSGGSREGIEIWDDWSSKGSKYKGQKDLATHWRTFHDNRGITVDYLLMHQVADIEDFDDLTDETPKEKKTKRKKFESILVSEWMQHKPPPYLVHGVLPQTDLAMFFGPSGSGKSFFVMDMLMCIATGRDWRGKEVKQGPVLWIAAEAATSMINRAKVYALKNEMEIPDNFRIITETPNLSAVEHVREIGLDAKKHKPIVIVVDTLTAAAGGANENSGQDMAVILAACRALHAASNALILIIHHAGKDATKGARGWSGVHAAMDMIMEITHLASGERIGKIAKQRDGEEGVEYPFKLIPIDLPDVDGAAQSSCVVESEEADILEEMETDHDWNLCGAMVTMIKSKDQINTKQFNVQLEKLAEESDLDTLQIDPSTMMEYFEESDHFDIDGKNIKLTGHRKQAIEEF